MATPWGCFVKKQALKGRLMITPILERTRHVGVPFQGAFFLGDGLPMALPWAEREVPLAGRQIANHPENSDTCYQWAGNGGNGDRQFFKTLRHASDTRCRIFCWNRQPYIEPYSHIITHIVKTTLDLPDDLLIAAKALAAQRKTTLKAMVEHALRREIAPQENLAPDSPYEVGPFGILSLKKRAEGLTSDQITRLIEHQYDEEDGRIISGLTGTR
jgi:hypothetical protein